MKIPTFSWTNCRYALILFTISVGIFIIVVCILYQEKGNNRFVLKNRRRTFDPSKLKKQCHQFTRKESVNWNYFYYYEDVRTKRSLVWCKVPKAGSTTLTKMFLRLAGAKDINNTTRIHKLLRNYYPRLSSKVMKHRLHTSKSFLVVRDPFERILSAYRDKLESYERDLEFRDGYYYDHYGRFMVKNNENETRKEPSWQEFAEYLLKTSVSRYDEHWMPITKLCSPCVVNYDIVIKMENFGTEVKKPLKYAKIDVSNLGWSHKTGTSSNRKTIMTYYKNLTLPIVKRLYVKYKRDFQLFGYTPYKYFKLFSETDKPSTGLNDTSVL